MKKQLLEFLNTYLTNDEIRFLSKGWVMVRALGTLVFVVCFISCENEIEYHGDNEMQQLVISADMAAGNHPACYVCSTTPTLGNVQLDTVWYERVYSDGHTERYYRMEHSRAFLSDASVRMRFNEGDWYTAVYDTDSKQYLVSGYTLSAGDRIELEVNHTTLGTATATQTVPKPVTVSAIHTADLYPTFTENGWVWFALDLDAYTGDDNALIGVRINSGAFTCKAKKTIRHEEKVYDESRGYTYTKVIHDTVVVLDTIPLTFLYAEGDMWDIPLNLKMSGCQYRSAVQPNYLYFPAAQLKQGKRIALFADQDWDNNILWEDSLRLLNLSIDVDVFSYDYYIYRTSVVLSDDVSLYDNRKFPTNYEYDEKYDYDGDYIEDIITEIGSLGNQEGIQIYSNIDGGIGHFATYTPTQLTIK